MPRATSSGSTCTKTQTQLFAGGTQPLCKCTLHVLLAAPTDMWDRLTASSFYKERSFLPRNQKPKGQGFRLLFGLFFFPPYLYLDTLKSSSFQEYIFLVFLGTN